MRSYWALTLGAAKQGDLSAEAVELNGHAQGSAIEDSEAWAWLTETGLATISWMVAIALDLPSGAIACSCWGDSAVVSGPGVRQSLM